MEVLTLAGVFLKLTQGQSEGFLMSYIMLHIHAVCIFHLMCFFVRRGKHTNPIGRKPQYPSYSVHGTNQNDFSQILRPYCKRFHHHGKAFTPGSLKIFEMAGEQQRAAASLSGFFLSKTTAISGP